MASPDDQAGLIMDACDYYEKEYEHVKAFVHNRIQSVVEAEASISGWMEIAVGALQDIETIMEMLESKEATEKLKHIRHYHNAYPKELSDRMVEKYADAEQGVQDFRMLRHYCANVRNMYHAGTKALDCMQYQLGHITKLKAVGLDDASLR